MVGMLLEPDTLMLRVDVGKAKDPETGEHAYEMSTETRGSTPIVRNVKTGRWFTLSWHDILTLAKEAGIDKPLKQAKKKKKKKHGKH